MIARVVKIESASQFTDSQRRITLRFEAADQPFVEVRFTERKLGIVGLALDDELGVLFATNVGEVAGR